MQNLSFLVITYKILLFKYLVIILLHKINFFFVNKIGRLKFRIGDIQSLAIVKK